MPPERKYKHYGQTPQPPIDSEGNVLKWTPARQSESNPAFKFLKAGLLDGSISHLAKPHVVYNLNPEFYVINPGKWPQFFVRAVKEVLGMEIDLEDANDSSGSDEETEPSQSNSRANQGSAASSASSRVPSYVGSSTKPTPSTSYSDPPPQMSDDMDISDGALRFAAPKVDDTGMVVDGTPVLPPAIDGSNKQVVLPSRNIPTEKGWDIMIQNVEGWEVKDVMAYPAKSDASKLIVTHKVGDSSVGSKIEKAYTKGTHKIIYQDGGKVKSSTLKLDRNDTNVQTVVRDAEETYGPKATSQKAPRYFHVEQLLGPIKPTLSGRQASNSTYLPAKYALVPREEIKGGCRWFVFSTERADNDKREMNYESDDSTVPESPRYVTTFAFAKSICGSFLTLYFYHTKSTASQEPMRHALRRVNVTPHIITATPPVIIAPPRATGANHQATAKT